MRNPFIAFVGAVVVTWSASASAQTTLPTPTTPRDQAAVGFTGAIYGNVDFGGQFTTVDGDAARYQRYRDLRDLPFVRNALFSRRGADWTLDLSADNVGLRDQRYLAQYRQVGRLRATFMWDETPLFVSSDTRLLYSQPQAGVFRLDDQLQSANQAGQTTIRDYTALATDFDVRSTRATGAFDLVYTASRELDFAVNVTSAERTGTLPYGAPFGFSNLIELPAPIDHRTTDARTTLEWANRRGMVSVGWDGSWFNNRVRTLIWDNPLKITDSPSYSSAYSDGKGPAQGRLALWPNNVQQYVHATGSIATGGRGRLTAYVAVGSARQNDELLPHTINAQIPVIPLERPTAEAEIRNTMLNVQYTARPARAVGVLARYRYADVDNRTPHFETLGRVRFDGVYDNAEASPEPEPYSVKRKTFEVDGTFNVLPYTAVKVGYTNAITDRTFRVFEENVEDVFRVSVDTTGNRYFNVRGLFEDSRRHGDRYDDHLLAEFGEQPGMRHYDVAERDRQRLTLIGSVTLIDILGFNASVGVGRDEYPTSEFGLQAYDTNQYSIGMDIVPNDEIGFNVSYAWEDYASLTKSRTALPPPSPQFDDPTRNWFMDYDGKVKNFDAVLDIAEVVPKTEMRFSVNWSDLNDTYLYVLPAGSTVTPQPVQLAPVLNEIFTGIVDVTYKLSARLRLGAAYWYEDYDVQDFALGSQIISDIALPSVQPGATPVPATTLLMGYMYRPYTANTGMVRLTYLW
jgi:MtrB/PioB family decaheme-associated outer membrane protein